MRTVSNFRLISFLAVLAWALLWTVQGWISERKACLRGTDCVGATQ